MLIIVIGLSSVKVSVFLVIKSYNRFSEILAILFYTDIINMSASNLVDPLTNKIYDQYIPQIALLNDL